MSMGRKDISWINASKAICIVLVYMYHSSVYLGYQEELLYSIYVPFFTNAFFFISGYLIFKKQLHFEAISMKRKEWMAWGGAEIC